MIAIGQRPGSYLQYIDSSKYFARSVSAPPCNDGEVRLLRDRVQMCAEEVWGYIFSAFWTKWHAKVVCRELGFPSEGTLCSS